MARLSLSHSRSEITRLSDWLDEQERLLPIPDALFYAVRLCLEEAVTNLVSHTPAASEQPDISVELVRRSNDLVAAIEDRGPPFDPRTVPLPERPHSLDDAVPGGLGIMLMRSFASEIDYCTVSGRNRLTFRFDLPVKAAPDESGPAIGSSDRT
jgi:serine/threonine-protein kinase RsbW